MSMGGKEDGGAGKAAKAQGKQAAAAAKKLTEYGDEAVSFTKSFYDKYIVPQMDVIKGEQAKGIERADTVYGQQQDQFKDREGTYRDKGKPAVNNYFDMVQNYDPEQEAQRRGLTTMGDITAQQQNAQAQTARGLAARGVNPTSGAAVAALGRNDLQANLVKAQEMARLRNLTQREKQGLTTDAANFGAGLGGQATALPGQSLQSGVIGSDIAKSAQAGLTTGAGIPMDGLSQASQNQANIFAPTKSAEANLQSTSAQAKAADGGAGALIGTVVGGIGGFMLGGPAGAVAGAQIGSGIA